MTALELTYEDVRALLHKATWDFLRAFGGEWEEARSGADVAFMLAYRRHDGDRSRFSTHLVQSVWWMLGKERMRESRRRSRLRSLPEGTPAWKGFDLLEFLEDLSPDARYLAESALELPLDVLLVLRGKGRAAGYPA